MRRPKLLTCTATVAIATGATLAFVSGAPAQLERTASHSKGVAERNVLRIVPRSWSDKRLAVLIDSRTGLLKNNVQVVCKGRGTQVSARRYRRFVCAIRPFHSSGRQALIVSYRSLSSGRCRVHWLEFRRN
jgi:hypothetical protein